MCKIYTYYFNTNSFVTADAFAVSFFKGLPSFLHTCCKTNPGKKK